TTTGVPVEVLTGSTLADIQAYADKLKPLLATTTAAPAAGPYAPALGTGAGTPPATDTTPGRGTLAAAFAASTKK
ncbi:MAG: hypothetical protein FWD75_02180, partial [Propionibacteriaceae bacterium]|nr:hypothetical protein [Propionibacteriaceae bacterium]